MKNIFSAVLAAICVCGARAEAVTSDTTVTLTGDSAESYEIAAGVTLTFSVASGACTQSGAITGAGAVRKEGSGELILSSSANSFSGGMYNSQGKLRATASGAFGTGGITNNGPARLIFDAAGGVFPNSVWQTGSTAMTYDGASIFFEKDTELGGGVTAVSADLILANYRSTTTPATVKGPRVVINGPVNIASGKLFYVYAYGTNTFMGAINDAGDRDYMAVNLQFSCGGTVELGSPESVWRYGPLIRSNVISCLADNVISNAILRWNYPWVGTTASGDYGSQVKLNGHSQRIRSLLAGTNASTATDTANGYMISSTAPATLTILGESTSRQCDCRIQDEITVVLDAKAYPNFVQTISNRTCTTTGDLIISNGTFRLKNLAAFPNVPNLVIAEGGTLSQQSISGLSLGGVTNCVIEGTFSVEGAGVPGLRSEKVSFDVGDNAKIFLDESDVVVAKSVRVGGAPLPSGSYEAGDSRFPQLKSGTIIVDSSSSAVDAAWTGAGDTDSVRDGGNWNGDDLDFDNGKLNATFAIGGDHATVSDAVSFGDLTFSPAQGTTGFTFRKGSDAAAINVMGETITAAAPATNTFEVPVSTMYEQTWNLPLGAGLVFDTNAMIRNDVKIIGGGAVEFNGCAELSTRFNFSNAIVRVNGTIATPRHADQGAAAYDGPRTMTVNADSATRLILNNAVIEKPVMMQAAIGTYPIVAEPGTTNIFKGEVRHGPSWYGIVCQADSEVIFRGGYVSPSSWSRINGIGTIRVQEKPMLCTQSLGWCQENGKLMLETKGNRFTYLCLGYQSTSAKPKLELTVSEALTNGVFVVGGNGAGSVFVPITAATFSAYAEFNATTQTVDTIAAYPNGEMHGDPGAQLVMVKQTKPARFFTDSNYYVASEISGALSLKMAGTGDLVMTNRAFSSCGDLEVVSGTLTMRNNATWLNGSNVTVRGTGTLRLDAGGRFGKHVEMHLGADEDAWTIAMPNGGVQRVACLYADDGTLLPSGIYGAAGVGGVTQTRYSAHFTGTGVLKVGRLGTRITIR